MPCTTLVLNACRRGYNCTAQLCVLFAHCTFCTETPNVIRYSPRPATASDLFRVVVVVEIGLVVVLEAGVVVVVEVWSVVEGAWSRRVSASPANGVGYEIVERPSTPGRPRRRRSHPLRSRTVRRTSGAWSAETDEPRVRLDVEPAVLAVPSCPRSETR